MSVECAQISGDKECSNSSSPHINQEANDENPYQNDLTMQNDVLL